MRPTKPISKEEQESLQELLREAKTKADFQRVQCLWLRAACKMNSYQVAEAVGLNSGTVRQIQFRYFKAGESALIGVGRGGRHNENLSLEEEDRLLAEFLNKSKTGGVLVANEVKAVYEKVVGRKVPKSTVYRMLARHGWRKIAPKHSHPKADILAQADFKKNSRSW
jgi:transposase